MWRIPLFVTAIPLTTASLLAQEARAIAVNDASLMRQMPGAGIEYRLPARVFPPELVEKLRSGGVYVKFLYRSFAQNAHKWTEIPADRWKALISDFAPVSVQGNGGNVHTMGRCPFTGKLFRGATMTDDEFRDTPFQAKVKGAAHIIYAREEDLPADYPARPNHTEQIPHLDGTTHAYRFYVPDEYRDAGPEFQSDRKHWFCPAGEVWRCRLRIVMAKVIPDLTSAVVLKNSAEAVKTLAVVLDRLADVYPGLPLYIGARAHGFARGPDRKGYLTAEQYRSIAPKQPFIHARAREDYPFWYVDIYDFSYAKLHGGVSAWTDGVMDQLGWIASAFDVIRDRPETLAFSRAKYGTPDAWEKRFRERCLKEIEYLALATPPTTGNTSYAYINGSVKVGIAAQNATLFRKGLEIIELYLYNNWSADGMAADAAFNYAAMTQGGILGLSWLNQFFGGVDLADRYGLKRTIDRLGIAPVTTLFNVQSKHADQHARFFRKQADAWGKPPATGEQDYGAHEASLCLPFYGLTALRGGVPGRRVELTVEQPQTLADGGGVICRMGLASRGAGLFASTLGGKKIQTPALELEGRMAALFPDAHRLTLVDGTAFRAQGWRLDLAPGWDLALADVVGDLTGEPTENALVVESARALPVDGTLSGHFVYVTHRCSPHLQSVYTIARVTRLDGKRWRIDLAGAPPFVTQRARVLKIDAKDPRQMEQHFQFHLIKGRTYSAGRRIRFLRSGSETALVETGRSAFSVVDEPPAGAVAKGDPFVVYSIQTGDRVRIPSRFVCQGRRTDAGQLRLSIASTGAATLQLPGAYQSALNANVDVRRAGPGTVVKIGSGALKDGKGVIHLQQ